MNLSMVVDDSEPAFAIDQIGFSVVASSSLPKYSLGWGLRQASMLFAATSCISVCGFAAMKAAMTRASRTAAGCNSAGSFDAIFDVALNDSMNEFTN